MPLGKVRGTAVITGATGGLGACFAKRLAEKNYSILLTDRCPERIEQVRSELAAISNVRIETCVADLANGAELESLAQRLSDMPDIELLINNAGFATVGHFADIDEHLHLAMIRVHVMAPSRLARAVLPGMIRRDTGAIINVSSLGAWLPSTGCAQYAATKSYLIVLSQAMQEELADTNVQVQVLCPGFIHSGFHNSETMTDFDKSKVPARLWTGPEPVVDYSLKSLSRHRLIAIPGWRNRLLGRFLQMPALKPLIRAVTRTKT